MKWKQTLILLGAFVVFLGYVLIFQRGEPPRKGQVMRFNQKKAARLEINYKQEAGPSSPQDVALEKRGDDWYVTKPLQGLADKSTVEQLLKDVSGLEAQSRFTKADANEMFRDHAKELGLEKPDAVIQAFDARNRALAKLQLGAKLQIGSDRYALANDQLITLTTWTADSLQKKAPDLRDKHLTHFKPDEVKQLVLDYPDRALGLERLSGDKWRLIKPVEAKAEGYSCNDLLTKVEQLEARDFLPPEKGKTDKDYGLDRPQIKVTVKLKGGKEQIVLLGSRKQDAAGDVVYAKTQGRDEILLVAATALTDLNKDMMAVRDAKLVSMAGTDVQDLTINCKGVTYVLSKKDEKWQMEMPKQGEVDESKARDMLWAAEDLRAKTFVAEHPTNLKPFGLDQPQARVELAGKGQSVTVSIGNAGGEKGQVYARSSEQEAVALVSGEILQRLPQKPEDLLKAPPPPPAPPKPPAAGNQVKPGGSIR